MKKKKQTLLDKLNNFIDKGYRIEFSSLLRMRTIRITYKNVNYHININELDFNEKTLSRIFDEAENKLKEAYRERVGGNI